MAERLNASASLVPCPAPAAAAGGVHSYGKCGRNRREEEEGGGSLGEDRAQRKAVRRSCCCGAVSILAAGPSALRLLHVHAFHADLAAATAAARAPPPPRLPSPPPPPPPLVPLHMQRILATYKFAFVPENSNDSGYVTEKVYEALQAGEAAGSRAAGAPLCGAVGAARG